ncbi:hypothetical protein ACFW4X_21000 [Streptomyces smyrnaeus]|uniref:hypothetical protein n=1 Tax=Streptomyces smyrnaeus TaxID=1387713 RepID=UPI0036B1ABF8
MGTIQQPTPEMGPYSTEVRRESFYLNRANNDAHGVVHRVNRYAVTLPSADRAALLATLAQVTGHRAWKEWQKSNPAPLDPEWLLPPDGSAPTPPGEWTVERDNDTITLRGPWLVHADHEYMNTEIAYESVTALRAALEHQ